jgi:arylsulfatase A-like enzyme
MNFIFICIDTLRYDHLGCNGNDWIKTPNLDAFAQEAVVFDNAYLGSFPTIPFRTDVFTGRFGEPLHPWLPLGFDRVTMPALFGQAGWATYLVFDTPHLINGGHGFDYPFHGWHFERGNEVDQHIIDDLGPDRPDTYAAHYNERLRRTTYPQYVRNNRGRRMEAEWPSPRVFKAAGDFVERNRRREKFFLWVDCFDPHEPWDPPEHYVALYDDPDFDRDCPMMGWEPLARLSPAELKHLQAHYAGEVTMVDHHLGIFLERLTASGRDKDTAVIVASDHGTNLGSHGMLSKGGPVYEQVGHTVFMVRLPGATPGRREGLVQPADFMPTLLELTGLPIPETCQGRSFTAAIAGTDDPGREVAISGPAIDVAAAEDAYLTVQDKRWCLIDRPDAARRELYDKTVDRAEEHNLIAGHAGDVEDARQAAERLHQALLDFLRHHQAHPALVRWFERGEKGDTGDYQHRPAYLANFKPYFQLALDTELHL